MNRNMERQTQQKDGKYGHRTVARAPDEIGKRSARGSVDGRDVARAAKSERSKSRDSTDCRGTTLFQDRVRDLDRLLDELVRLHQNLLDALQRKLASMRKNDIDAIHDCVACEGALTERIADREGLRARLTVLIGQDLGVDEEQARRLTISGLADRLHGGSELKLRVTGERLCGVVKELAKVNKVIAGFAGRMLEHHRHIFGQITTGLAESPVYLADGGASREVAARVFDATG